MADEDAVTTRVDHPGGGWSGSGAGAHRNDHAWHCSWLEGEITRFADAYQAIDGGTPVPSCPGWSADALASHLGMVHRWAEHLVRVRAPARISASQMNLDKGPPTPEWIREGGNRLVRTLHSVDPAEEMWSWGPDQHARFWSRRQLHETLVHRVDLELASDRSSEIDAEVAIDAVDELLGNLASAAAFSPAVAELRGAGQRLRLQAGDRAGWTVILDERGFHVTEHGPAPDAELAAEPAPLLLVLYRRWPRRSAGVIARGDVGLVDFWLRHSALR
jgi:uncharacterized protein (TIGR03083 family)